MAKQQARRSDLKVLKKLRLLQQLRPRQILRAASLDLATGHRGYIAAALGTIARAYGMSKFTEETGLTRSTLYNATSEDGNPTLETLLAIISKVGVRLSATAS